MLSPLLSAALCCHQCSCNPHFILFNHADMFNCLLSIQCVEHVSSAFTWPRDGTTCVHPSKLSLDQRMEQPVSILANFLTNMLPSHNKPFFPSSTLILITSYDSSVSILNETSAGQLQRLISALGRGRREIGEHHWYSDNASPSLSVTNWYRSSLCSKIIICIIIWILNNQIITETSLQSDVNTCSPNYGNPWLSLNPRYIAMVTTTAAGP